MRGPLSRLRERAGVRAVGSQRFVSHEVETEHQNWAVLVLLLRYRLGNGLPRMRS